MQSAIKNTLAFTKSEPVKVEITPNQEYLLLQDGNSLELRALRLPEVLRLTGDKRSHWYSRLNPRSSAYDPNAPQSFRLGDSCRSPAVWWYHEVVAWLQFRASTSRKKLGVC